MNNRPLVMHVLYRLDTGGMERIVVSLINATGDRYRHALITLTGFGPWRREIEDSAVVCRSLDKKPGKDWSCYFRFWRALRALRPDLVQTYNIGTLDFAPMVKLAGVHRLVHAEHGRDVTDPRGDNPKYRRLRRWMAPFIERYIAVSPDLQSWLTQDVGIKPAKVTYIANGIDIAAFNATRSRSGPRKLLGDFAPLGSVLIGNVARLDKVKDHAGLILAFKLLREELVQRNGDCRLVIAGDGPERGELERRVEELGLTRVVRLLGNRADVAELLAECDVFALSSVAEGMPLTVLEAMAAGLPVVATDVGSIASVIEAGVTGMLVPAGEPRALARALSVYVLDEKLRRQQGNAGRARVTARFSLSAMVSAYAALYDELLGQRTSPLRTRAVRGLTGPKEH